MEIGHVKTHDIFGQKDKSAAQLDQTQVRAQDVADFRHGFQHRKRDVDQNEDDQEVPQHARADAAFARVLKHLIERPFEFVAGHRAPRF